MSFDPRETGVVGAISRGLKSYRPLCKYVNITVGESEVTGTPDIIGSYRGRTFLIEAKTVTGQPSEKQKYEIMKWRQAGAIVIVARTWAEVKTAIFDVIDAELDGDNG